jgi:hypothetical protein
MWFLIISLNIVNFKKKSKKGDFLNGFFAMNEMDFHIKSILHSIDELHREIEENEEWILDEEVLQQIEDAWIRLEEVVKEFHHRSK